MSHPAYPILPQGLSSPVLWRNEGNWGNVPCCREAALGWAGFGTSCQAPDIQVVQHCASPVARGPPSQVPHPWASLCQQVLTGRHWVPGGE